MRILGVIPARMAATRFPNKPMALIENIPMVGHCYFRSIMCELLDEVYVATCDDEIFDYISNIGGKAMMTSTLHERATERTAEALQKIEELNNCKYDIVVMIQGDEPLIDPNMINEAILPLKDHGGFVSNLMSKLNNFDEAQNPNFVKVVTTIEGDALYLSREPIPSSQKYSNSVSYYRQLGLIAFSREALLKFVNLQTTPLEIIESVDMNRFLENNIPIKMKITEYEADSVDTKEDLERVIEKMKIDKTFLKYKLV
jgi:3-deoxy-manno-octulosonate cytidylyltransferase (CMP-KDO synthetase)